MNPKTCIINSLTKEEQELLYFAEPVGYHTRLQQYWAYPQGFAERTTQPRGNISLSTTKTFRCCLRRFWQIIRERCRFPATNLPLFIEDFSSRIKKCADYDALLQRSIPVSSQVIIL